MWSTVVRRDDGCASVRRSRHDQPATEDRHQGRSRCGRRPVGHGRRRRWWTSGLVAVALVACSPHPIGPARTLDDYEGKASTTATSARSAVETVRLAAEVASTGDAFGPYVSVLVSDQEESLSGVTSTFGSIQPPSHEADGVRDRLLALLDRASADVARVRIAARRGSLRSLDDVARPLRADALALERFVEARS